MPPGKLQAELRLAGPLAVLVIQVPSSTVFHVFSRFFPIFLCFFMVFSMVSSLVNLTLGWPSPSCRLAMLRRASCKLAAELGAQPRSAESLSSAQLHESP